MFLEGVLWSSMIFLEGVLWSYMIFIYIYIYINVYIYIQWCSSMFWRISRDVPWFCSAVFRALGGGNFPWCSSTVWVVAIFYWGMYWLPCAEFFLHRGHARSASFLVPSFISDCEGNLLCQHWKSQDRLQFETLSSKLFKYLKHQSSNKNSSSKNRMIQFCFLLYLFTAHSIINILLYLHAENERHMEFYKNPLVIHWSVVIQRISEVVGADGVPLKRCVGKRKVGSVAVQPGSPGDGGIPRGFPGGAEGFCRV